MAELTYLQAISDGLRTEMRRDKRVFVIGEDVGVYGGAFKVTLGFQEEFGHWRVLDAPLAETAIVGACTGAAIMGLRPVAEMQFADFISCAWDHLVTVAAKQRYRAGTPVPITVRLPSGGGFSGGPFHSQNPESSFAHIPGLKCVCPATPEDAKGLLISAIEDPNPVLYFEHKHLYRRIKGEVPEERYTVRLSNSTRTACPSRSSTCARSCPGTRPPCSNPRVRRPRCSCCTRTLAPAVSAPRSRPQWRRRRSRISTRRSSASLRPTRRSRSRRRSRRHSSRRWRTSPRACASWRSTRSERWQPPRQSTSSCRRWACPSPRVRSPSG